MRTEHIRDYFNEHLQGFEGFIVGPLFETQRERLLSIKRGVTSSPRKPIGTDMSSYSRIAVNCILHWNKSYRETEEKSLELRDFILSLNGSFIDDKRIGLVNLRNFVPIGTDENDINEYAIDFEMIYSHPFKG